MSRVVKYDILRVAACFSIVLLHVSASYWSVVDVQGRDFLVMTVYNSVTRFAVPVFFMLSGLFLVAPERKNVTVGKRVLKLVLLFYVWSAFYAFQGIAVDTLRYLKRGGRITGTAAALGTVLNIKPVLLIDGAKLDVYKKVRGKAAAKDVMIQAVKDTIATKFKGLSPEKDLLLYGVYSQYNEEAKEWNARLQQEFPGIPFAHEPLSLSIACHIGPGAVAVVVLKRSGR